MTLPPPTDYCFVALDSKDRSFELDITESDDRVKKHFQSVWQRLSGAVEQFHKTDDSTPPAWVTWAPWRWCEQRDDYAARQKFVAWSGSHLVGFLNVWRDFPSVHQPAESCLYIEHLAAAPGNLETALWNKKYRYVGMALLAYSVWLSQQLGTTGRVALHASDDEALDFYRRVSAKVGNGLFLPERTGVLGPTPHSRHGDAQRVYMETSVEGAVQLLEDYRRA